MLSKILISVVLHLFLLSIPFVTQAVSSAPMDPFMVGMIAKIKKPQLPKVVRPKFQRIVSSWYGPGFDGRRTASGTTYHQEEMTVASRTLRFGTLLLITGNEKYVIARVTDRGPYIVGRDLDVSKGVARKLGMLKTGVMALNVAVINEDSIRPILYNFSPQSVPKRAFHKLHGHVGQSSQHSHLLKQPTSLLTSHVPIVRTYTLYHPHHPMN